VTQRPPERGGPAAARLRLPFSTLVGVAAAGFLGLAVAAVHFAPVTDASPIVPEGIWKPLYAVGVLGALLAYLAGLALLRRRHAPAVVALAVAAAIQLAPLFAPLLLSKDVYAYWGYARVGAVQGGNPYVDPPEEFPHDAAFPHVAADWREATTLYGPIFTLSSEAHAAAAGTSPTRAAFGHRLVAAAAVLALTALAAVASSRPAFAAAFVGWNPLLALHFAGGGHNDALMMVPVLAALAFAARGRGRAAGAAWVLAIAVKWVPLVLLPLWLLAARPPLRRTALAGIAAAVAVLALVASLRYGTAWLGVFAASSADAQWTSSNSLPHHLGRLGVPNRYAIAALGLLFAVAYLFLLREAWRGRARLALAAGLLPLSAGWLSPWYAIWAVSLAAIDEDRAGRVLAIALTIYLLRDAVQL
jgi:hypothetical protein